MDNLLVHIVALPVLSRWIIPLAGKRVLHTPTSETRDKVGTADDILRIEEPKRTLLVFRDKLNAVQPFCSPPSTISVVNLEPTNPEDIHVRHFGHDRVQNLDPVNPKDTRIDVWVGRVVVGKRNHVWAASRVDLVYPSSKVIGSIIHAHCAPLLKGVAGNKHLVTVIVCEGGGFWIVLLVIDASEEVVHQFWDKVLAAGQ